jgi:hypothetical protein
MNFNRDSLKDLKKNYHPKTAKNIMKMKNDLQQYIKMELIIIFFYI